jgi:SAM-dependent methyltransferase
MENDIQKITCPICHSNESRLYTNKNNYNYYKCPQCGLIFLWPIMDLKVDIYDQEYFQGAGRGYGYISYDQDKVAHTMLFKKIIKLILKLKPKAGTIFDIGAATGFFLEIARQEGLAVSGIEISDYAASLARGKGIEVATGSIDDIDFEKN